MSLFDPELHQALGHPAVLVVDSPHLGPCCLACVLATLAHDGVLQTCKASTLRCAASSCDCTARGARPGALP